jgi:hypothetical protein
MMGAKPFLITGLPRSRTAWLSVFMTTGSSICYHDAIAAIAEIEECAKLFKSEFYKFVGVADCGFVFFLDWILENIKPRTLIVERDPAEVTESLVQLGLPRSNIAQIMHAELIKFRTHPLVMWAPFESLERKRVIQKAFWHLMPGEAFDDARYEHLAKMRIETDVKRTFEQYRQHQHRLDYLMRGVMPKVKVMEQPSHAAI